MKKSEVVSVLGRMGITLDEIKQVYKELVKEAKVKWYNYCLAEAGDCERGLPPQLIALIGYNSKYGLMKKCKLQFGYENGMPEEWYYATAVSILNEDCPQPIVAADYLYNDAYFIRTGKVSKKIRELNVKDYPLSIKDFETVVVEMINACMRQ